MTTRILQNIEILGVMGYPLLICAILLVLFTLERVIFFMFFAKKNAHNIQKKLHDILKEYAKSKKEVQDEAISFHFNEQKHIFVKFVTEMKFIASISPTMGLLGTLIGIIKAFKVISQNTNISPKLIASQLNEALYTSALGLAISLIALIVIFIIQKISYRILKQISNTINSSLLENNKL